MYRDILLLQPEKAPPLLIAGNCADLGATEDAIPVSHNTPIPQIQKEFRQQPQQKCNPSPETSNLLQDEKHGRRPGEQMLARKFSIDDHIHRIERRRADPMPRENAYRESALQRRKTKHRIPIPPENKPDKPVAKSANAIVKNNRMRHG
jgi:hypothetical protein